MLVTHQKNLPSFQKLQGGASAVTLREPFYRGLLTLEAMKQLPIDTYPALAGSANFWAPVQAYYVLHGIGLAVLLSLGVGNPRNHRTFRSLMATHVVAKLFPYPFNMYCTGDPFPPSGRDTKMHNFTRQMSEVVDVSNLASPDGEKACLLAAKSLFTSRKRFLLDKFDEHRNERPARGKSRRNLTAMKKQKLSNAAHPSTIVDFLYRIRVRSNYDDPEMFMYGQSDDATASRHYKNLLSLIETCTELCKMVIRKKIGDRPFSDLMDQFESRRLRRSDD